MSLLNSPLSSTNWPFPFNASGSAIVAFEAQATKRDGEDYTIPPSLVSYSVKCLAIIP